MANEVLEPSFDLLRQEYLLVPAWKKTTSYIRHHNWFSDTLALDRAAVNLRRFLAEMTECLNTPERWTNDQLRIVPAPKSQQWRVSPDAKLWEPVNVGETAAQLRPLAHVSLKDQVAATALMLCLANRVETIQGDPSAAITEAGNRKRVVAYGNRLFCDAKGQSLYHRWGSAKLYRAYYQDYGCFLSRPEIAAQAVYIDASSRVAIVHSDLRQFYDRVRPELLTKKLDSLKNSSDDARFYAFAHRLLNWEWAKKDSQEVARYAEQADLSDFSQVALPQGLVAAGFFANVVLLDFDRALREAFTHEIDPGVRLDDACRYVDDLRIVLTIDRQKSLSEIEQIVVKWLQQLLNRHANGLLPAEGKTRATIFRGDERPLVRQSRKMARIQGAVSGGFDAIGGEEILDAVQGLVRAQQRYSEHRAKNRAGHSCRFRTCAMQPSPALLRGALETPTDHSDHSWQSAIDRS